MTFTNKAANEMKERILSKLIQLSKHPRDRNKEDQEEVERLTAILAISPEALSENAQKCLNSILHNYNLFSVLTIDKFTHKVIRTFARDLGLSVDFEVELDLDTLRRNVADMLFDQIGKDQEVTELMRRYVDANLEEEKSWQFKESLVDFSKQLFQEDALRAIKLLGKIESADFENIRKSIITDHSKYRSTLARIATEAVDLIESNQLTDADFKNKSSGLYAYFRKVIEGSKLEGATTTLINYVRDDKIGDEKSVNYSTLQGISDALSNYFHQIEEFVITNLETYKLNTELLKIVNNLSLMKHLLSLSEQLKKEDNILLISDFYKEIANIIASEPVPFIYERLGVRYDHFLLDEFQDTSHMQWVNLVPLLHNSLAHKNYNLIVGDGKQAIYRWRNGEVEQFVKLPDMIFNPDGIESLKEAEFTFKNEGQSISLSENYRSAPAIVEFNNAFFQELIAQQDPYIKKVYEEHAQKAVKTFDGYLEFKPFEEKDSVDLKQVDYVLQTINRCIEKGFSLSDICILVRSNKKGTLLSSALAENAVPVVSQDALYVGKDVTVRFLYYLIGALAVPHASNYTKKTIEHYDLIFNPNQQHLMDIDDDKFAILQWLLDLGYDIKSSDHFHSFYEYVEYLIEVFDFDLDGNAYLQFFLEQVHLFEKRHSHQIHAFLEWFNDKGKTESIQSPEGAEAVQLLTIHKAKGLQFPVVICAWFDWDYANNLDLKWIVDEDSDLPAYYLKSTKNTKKTKHQELLEREDMKTIMDSLNLVYVAFTRAERMMFVSGSVDNRGKGLLKDWVIPHLDRISGATSVRVEEQTYKIGNFDLVNVPEKKHLAEAYDLKFLKQKFGKPQLSFKNAEQWVEDDKVQHRRYGTQLHELFAGIKKLDEFEEPLQRLIRKGKIDKDFEDRIREDLKRLIKHEQFKSYFDPSVNTLSERGIVDKDGNKYVPDRILFEEEQIRVVDFKTGQAHSKSHLKQVKDYVLLLKDMYQTTVKGELFYTEDATVVPIV